MAQTPSHSRPPSFHLCLNILLCVGFIPPPCRQGFPPHWEPLLHIFVGSRPEETGIFIFLLEVEKISGRVLIGPLLVLWWSKPGELATVIGRPFMNHD